MIDEQKQFMIRNMLATLNNEHALTKDAHMAREAALEYLPELMEQEGVVLDNLSLDQMLTAYFMCTYAHHPKKHRIKRSINRILQDNMTRNGIVGLDAKELLNRRYGKFASASKQHRVLVITNHFRFTHVMYRCFAPSLRVIKERFESINLCLHESDFEAANLFHRQIVVNIPPKNYLDVIADLRKIILEIAPDVILYADIAMHPFGVFLANLRLAPLQVVIAGHPAPSQSDFIDAFIMPEFHRGDVADYVEPVEFFPTHDYACERPKAKPLGVREPHERTRVVIPTSLHKITFPFLEMLKRIGDATGCEFHMTSGIINGNEQLEAIINSLVPNLTYYPNLHYDDYIKLIAQCDCFLMPFPFSGFSTLLDCFTQSVPGLVMDMPGMEARQGVLAIQRGAEGNSFTARSKDEYFDMACKLINNDGGMRERAAWNLDLMHKQDDAQPLLYQHKATGIADTIAKLLDRMQGQAR